MIKPIAAAIVVYLLADALSDFLLAPIGLEYMHAFIAMFCGMFVGGYLAKSNFVWIALGINLFFSIVTYVAVAQMRDQSVVSLFLEQHLMVSAGSFVGAALGAWVGQKLKVVRKVS